MLLKPTYNALAASKAKILLPHPNNKYLALQAFRAFLIFLSPLIFNLSSSFAQTGRIVLNNNPYIVFNSTATAYIVINNSNANAIRCLPSDNCHTDGRIITYSETNKIRWYAQTATGNYIVPYYSDAMIPFGFNKTTAGTEVAAGTGYFEAMQWYTLNNATWPAGTSLCGLATEGDVVDRFWTIDVPGYTANPTATMRFYYNPGDVTFPEEDLLAQRWNSALADACKWETPVGTAFPINNYVEVTTSSFSPWALTNKNNPLPIELLSFTANCIPLPNGEGQGVGLKWTTASEINNDYFSIERSADGVTFENIATIQGAGNSSTQINYEFADIPPLSNEVGAWYYRLKQTDFDGSYSYSPIIAVKSCAHIQQTTIQNIYTQLDGEIHIIINSPIAQTYNLAFYNAIGQIITKDVINVQKGENNYTLQTHLSAAAIYFTILYNQTENITYKSFLK